MDGDSPEREHVEHLFAALATVLLIAVINIGDACQHTAEDWMFNKLGRAAFIKDNVGQGLSNAMIVAPVLLVFVLALLAFGRRACIRAAILGCAIGLAAIAWSMNIEIKTAPVVSVAEVDAVWAVASIAAGLALVGAFDRIALRCWHMITARFFLPQIKAWSETQAGCRINWGLAGAATFALGIWEIVEGFIREMAGPMFGSLFVAFCLLLGGFAVVSAILSAVLPAIRRPAWLQRPLTWVETP